MTTEHSPNTRGRRVTDNKDVPFDSARQALDIERLSSQHQLLAAQVKNSVDNFSHTLQSVQAEMRSVSEKISDLTGLQHAHDANRESLARMENSVQALSGQWKEWTDDFEESNERRWERHEQENKDTRDTVLKWTYGAIGLSLCLGALGGMFTWNLQKEFNDVTDANATAALRIEKLRDDKNAKDEELQERLHEIELYLTRGGEYRREPYVKPTR